MNRARKRKLLLQVCHRCVKARVEHLGIDGMEIEGKFDSLQSVILNYLAHGAQAKRTALVRPLWVGYPSSQRQRRSAKSDHVDFSIFFAHRLRN